MSALSCVNIAAFADSQPNFCAEEKSSSTGSAISKIVTDGPLMAFVVIPTLFSPVMNQPMLSQHNSVSEVQNNTVQIEPAEREVDVVYRDTDYMRLEQISHLTDDWNGYGAKSFPSALVKKCQSIFLALPVAPHIYPTGRQSIQFQYELPDRSYLEFEIFEKRTTCLLVPQRQYGRAETKEFTSHEKEKITEMVIKFYE